MPRKTKKQKILAKLHRLEKETSQGDIAKDSTENQVEVDSERLTLTNLKPETSFQTETKKSDYDYSYVYKDIRKILILTVLALFVEIALSLTASNGYAKLALRSLNLDL